MCLREVGFYDIFRRIKVASRFIHSVCPLALVLYASDYLIFDTASVDACLVKCSLLLVG